MGIRVFDYNNVKIYSNTIDNMEGLGISWEVNVSTTADGCKIYDNTLRNISQNASLPHPGIQIGGATGKTVNNCEVYRNTIHGNMVAAGLDAYGIDIDIGSDALVYQNIVSDCTDGGIEFIGAQSSTKIYYNIIYNCGKGDSSLARAGITWGSKNSNGEAYNNMIYDCYRGLAQTSGSQSAIVKNNIVMNTTDYHVYNTDASSCKPTLDYNCYYPDGAGKFMWQGTDSDSFADWQSDSGQDTNSKVFDPHLSYQTGRN